MLKKCLFVFVSAAFLFASYPGATKTSLPDKKIKIHNKILAKIDDKIISTMDLKKRLDFVFYQQFPEYSDVPEAKYQFYSAQWRPLLEEMVNNALILSEALSKEEKMQKDVIDEAEIKKEIEDRFGPDVIKNLNKAGLVYDEVFQDLREKKIMDIMLWTAVYSKVFSQITPKRIHEEYQAFVENHPPQNKIDYQVVTIRGKDEPHTKLVTDTAYKVLQTQGLEAVDALKPMVEKQLEDSEFTLNISNREEKEERQLSQAYLSQLSQLAINAISAPIEQLSRNNTKSFRIFIVYNKSKEEIPAFESMEKKLAEQLQHTLIQEKRDDYVKKLRQNYGLGETITDPSFVPFVLE